MRKRKLFLINDFSQCEIEFWVYFLAILWKFSDFLEKWFFFLCKSALKKRFVIYELGPCPFVFVKHLDIYSTFSSERHDISEFVRW